MTDVNTANTNDTPPPPSEPVGTPIEDRITNPIEGGSDEERVRESVRALNEKRQRERESSAVSDAFAEQNPDITALHYEGRHHKTKSLKEVSDDVTAYHRMQKPDARLAIERFGGDPEQVAKVARDPAFGEAYGLTPQEAAEWARSGQMPPTKIGVFDEKRGLRDRIADHENIYDRPRDELFKNAHAATKQQGNFREALTAELTRQELALQEAEALALNQQQQQTAPAEQATPQPTEQAAPTQQPQADPLAAERQRLAFEAQLHAAQRQVSYDELKAQTTAEEIVRAYPELQNQAAIEETYRRNPARFAELQRAAQALQQCQQQFIQANQARQVREAQLKAHEQQHVRQVYADFSKQQDELFSRSAPEMKDARQRYELVQGTKATLKNTGFTDDEVAEAWHGYSGIPLRDHRVQQILRKAALFDKMHANARNIANNRAPLPQVLRPGTARPRGADGAEDIARLERQLADAKGDKAIRIAAALTRARRAL
jgi:hypothetical protein